MEKGMKHHTKKTYGEAPRPWQADAEAKAAEQFQQVRRSNYLRRAIFRVAAFDVDFKVHMQSPLGTATVERARKVLVYVCGAQDVPARASAIPRN